MSGTAPAASDKADLISEWGVVVVSVVVLAVFLGAIVVAWVTKSNALDTLLGFAGANATTAVGFWLGSSRGSQKKDALLAAAPPPAPETPKA